MNDRRQRRMPKWTPWLVAVLVAAGGGFVGGWWFAGADVRTDVRIVSDAQSVQCFDTQTSTRAANDSDSVPFVVREVAVVPEMKCELRFFIENVGSRSATVTDISMPDLVSAGVAAVHLDPVIADGAAASLTSVTLYDPTLEGLAAPETDGGRWQWNVDDVIAGGTRQGYSIWLVYEPTGCLAGGSTIGVSAPTLNVDAWGRNIELEASSTRVFFLGAGFNEC